jgi:hypothetical protein
MFGSSNLDQSTWGWKTRSEGFFSACQLISLSILNSIGR